MKFNFIFLRAVIAVLGAWVSAQLAFAQQGIVKDDVVLESLPDPVLATMEARNRFYSRLQLSNQGQEYFVIDKLQRWNPGKPVSVAFLGGDPQLHKEIAGATEQIMDACGIALDFGLDPNDGSYRTWSLGDSSYKADIRVSFDQHGYFSLVGTDSIARNIGKPTDPVGGRPNQRSLNLGGFDIQKPPQDWEGIVRHEFLHALGFNHEHQSQYSPCEEEFRWEDDPGYHPTKDADGRYVTDSEGRRPGIYTYAAGHPNYWPRVKVDNNLRRYQDVMGAEASSFDRFSIMLYRFPDVFYQHLPSPCAPLGDGMNLSPGDIKGLLVLYPKDEDAAREYARERLTALRTIAEIAERENLPRTVGGVAAGGDEEFTTIGAILEQLSRPLTPPQP